MADFEKFNELDKFEKIGKIKDNFTVLPLKNNYSFIDDILPKSKNEFENIVSLTSFLPPSLSSHSSLLNNPKELINNLSYITPLDKEAEKYQNDVLKNVTEDPTLTDYTVVYRRLNEERNKPWKLNPSDIADFYLLEQFISAHSLESDTLDDSTNLALLKAKTKVAEIGNRLLVALLHEQLDEYDRFTIIKPDKVPDKLKAKIHDYYMQKVHGSEEKTTEGEMNFLLADFKALMDQNESRADEAKITEEKDLVNTVLQILECQQGGRWKTMASAMKALYDKTSPISDFIKNLSSTESSEESIKEFEKVLGDKRDMFLIDRLLNYVHNTGTMSARVTNYFPRSASLLVAHGMADSDQYLFYYSSLAYGHDTLSTKLRNNLDISTSDNIVHDLTEMVKTIKLPREYMYALLLEFNNPNLNGVIQQKTAESLTPSSIYTLLQKISHHDGTSKGRLKKAA